MLEGLVVPGRFQPLHEGHLHVFRYALERAKMLYIVVGSAQESFTLKNPLTAGERIVMLEKALEEDLGGGWHSRIRIYPIMDINMNKVWVRYLEQLLPPFDGVVSGNELVLALFEDAGLEAIRPPLYRRGECSGTIIRRRILEGDPGWRSCVPRSVVEYLDSIGFTHRIVRLAKHE
ncbi:MAG: nicotinamide-nucleotide adenylyltransferase [Desulfurococcales archaeon]|nr:nicotinamide-nucleotide adenylyltransferase [Desulfurococcales archaeon]